MKLSDTMKPLECGGCGGTDHLLFQALGGIATECKGCGSVSVIKPAPAQLDVEWGPGEQLGCLAVHGSTT